LAKKLHPDRNSNPDAKARFQEMTEAFRIVSDSERRANYDDPCDIPREQAAPADVSPVSCSRCGKVTAQPRYLIFRYVMGLLIVTRRNAWQGIYCVGCARKTSLCASAISALAGWWGIPWGPICTIGEIWRNAFGGIEPPRSRERLLWRNALAFASQGNNELSYALARELRTSGNREIASKAARLMDSLKMNGVNAKAAHLKSAWSTAPQFLALHLALLLIAPGLVLGIWVIF
jgi:hypothetical protein